MTNQSPNLKPEVLLGSNFLRERDEEEPGQKLKGKKKRKCLFSHAAF